MMEKKILTMASFNKFDWEIFPLSIVFFTANAAIRKVEEAKQRTVMWFPEYISRSWPTFGVLVYASI